MSEYQGALNMLECLIEEFDHLGREFMKKGKQREARAIMFAVENLIKPHLEDLKTELKKENKNATN